MASEPKKLGCLSSLFIFFFLVVVIFAWAAYSLTTKDHKEKSSPPTKNQTTSTSQQNTTPKANSTSGDTSTTSQQTTTPAPKEPTWVRVGDWSGQHSWTNIEYGYYADPVVTNPFTTSGKKWRIVWAATSNDNTNAKFTISVYDKSGGCIEFEYADTIGWLEGQTQTNAVEINGAGIYYVEFSCFMCSWSAVVEDGQ
jgi:cytoskeletal protein RodZ